MSRFRQKLKRRIHSNLTSNAPPHPDFDDVTSLHPVTPNHSDTFSDPPVPAPSAHTRTSALSVFTRSRSRTRSHRSAFGSRIRSFFDRRSTSRCSTNPAPPSDLDDLPISESPTVNNFPQLPSTVPPIQPQARDQLVYGQYIECGACCPPGRCNDGFLSIIRPDGWLAKRVADGFMLFNGLAVGFAMVVSECDAVKVLLETARLQVMSEVSALSSPVFVRERELKVLYSSFEGAGIGVAIFRKGFHRGASVFALCGPKEDAAMIESTMKALTKSVIVIAVPSGLERLADAEGVEEKVVEQEDKTESGCLVM